MKHEAIRIDYADGNALVCLVGRNHPDEPWYHQVTLSRRCEEDSEGVADAARVACASFKLELLQ